MPRISRARRTFTFLLAAPVWVACGADDGDLAATFVVRDSAGIRIIENHAPIWGTAVGALDASGATGGRAGGGRASGIEIEGASAAAGAVDVSAVSTGAVQGAPSARPLRWAVDPEPAVRIGTIEGAAAYMFDRLVGATRLSDGTIVVADDGHKQLRFFDVNGSFIRAVGREGEGPGEFLTIEDLTRCAAGADSIFAFDYARGLMSVFTAAGEFVRAFRLEGPPPRRSVYGWSCASDGSIVVVGWPSIGAETPPGPHRPSVPVALASARDGRVTAAIGAVPGDDRYRDPTTGDNFPAFFGRRTLVAIGGGRTYIGTGDGYEIRVHGLDGTLVASIRRPTATRPITAADLARFREARLEGVSDPNQRRGLERFYLAYEFPSTFPPYSAFEVDARGRLWVRGYPIPGVAEPAWSVFDVDGAWLGDVTLPPGLDVFEIGSDYVLGRAEDALGVDYVQLHRLREGG